jgi:hypothetical protein
VVAVAALIVAGALVVLAALRWGAPGVGGAGAGTLGAAAKAENDRGAGLMGQFEFARAEEAFEAAEALAGDGDGQAWIPAFNRAIARLNRSEEGAQASAIEWLRPLVDNPASRTRAQYAQGLAALYLGDPRGAAPSFEAVAKEHPKDAYAHFYVAQCRELAGDLAGARAAYERAAEIDPLLRSSWLGLQRTAARLGDEAAASAALERFQALAEDLRSTLAEFKYTRMGPLAEVVLDAEDGSAARADVEAPSGPRDVLRVAEPFPLRDLPERFPTEALGRPSVVDVDGDGTMDLVFAAGEGRPGLVALGEPDGVWRAVPTHPLARMPAAGFLWGDLDNDGRVDAVANGPGPAGARVRMQGDRGEWTNQALGDVPELVALLLADVDYDGDLDVVASSPEGVVVMLGRGDGTFRPRALGGDGPAVRASAADLDGDGDLELLLVRAAGAARRVEVWRLGPLWQWERVREWEPAEPAAAAIGFAGAEGEGRYLLALVADGAPAEERADDPGASSAEHHTLVLWSLRRGGMDEVFRRRLPGVEDATVASFEASGEPLILATGRGTKDSRRDDGPGSFAMVLDAGGHSLQTFEGGAALRLDRATPGVLDAAGVRVLLPPAGPGAALQQIRVSAPPEAFAVLSFRGRVDPSQQMRSNASGIGTACVARAGGRWSAGTALPRTTVGGGVQQSLEPVVLGLHDAPRASFVTMQWPDGVTQTELDVPPGARTVVETQRQISSCPVIFAWNGREHAFVTDCLGVGGLGYLAGIEVAPDGTLSPIHAPPRPWERVLLGGADALTPRAGAYDIRIGEPMEEACYLDAVRLVAVDVPDGWEAVPDERMAINGPEPTGEALMFRRSMLPERAEVGVGGVLADDAQDARAIEALARRDGVAVELGPADRRFIGRLSAEALLELRFPAPIDAEPGAPILVVDGWVEYPYGQTMFAMWQAEAAYEAPTLEALDPESGHWVVLEREMGYPAGMPRTAVLPIPRERLPRGCRSLRLRTTMEVYFDRIRLAWCEPCPEVTRTEAPLEHAICAFAGFPRRVPQPQRRPDFTYAERAPLWDCRMQVGVYTAYGDCTPLLADRDDAIAIFGAGEEIRLRFREIPPPAPGMRRHWILETDGWCKDMDRYTGDGRQLGPLPGRGEDAVRRDALHARFNTRITGGR